MTNAERFNHIEKLFDCVRRLNRTKGYRREVVIPKEKFLELRECLDPEGKLSYFRDAYTNGELFMLYYDIAVLSGTGGLEYIDKEGKSHAYIIYRS